jgi:hypothetical protein
MQCYPKPAYTVLWSLETGPAITLAFLPADHVDYDPDLETSRRAGSLALGILVSAAFFGGVGAIAFRLAGPREGSLWLLSLYLTLNAFIAFIGLLLWETG